MFYLHISNKTENLLKHLGAVIDADRKPSVFEKEFFLIQSRGMERMLSQGLSDQFGCWCNFEYLLPLGFLNLVGERLGMRITPDHFERDLLTWRIEELLRDLNGQVYTPLQQYLTGENLALKRFQLAKKLADIFDQYQMMRPEMLALWDRGRTTTKDPAEKWQLHLWQRLHDDPAVSPHRGILIKKVIDRLCAGEELSSLLPSRLFIFGLHSMPALFLEYVNAFSLHSQVHLFLLSPCEHYWGNIDTRRRQVKLRIEQLRNGQKVPLMEVNHHPLLVTLGRQGSEFQEMLLDQVQFEIELKSFEDPRHQPSPNLLHHIQSDLLAGRVGTTSGEAIQVKNDGSVKIVATHSKVRELTILKDYILDWLQNDHHLESSDIIVMAPDIQEYAPLISTIFKELPHSIADRNMGRRNQIVSVYLEFLEILTGRFGWSELLDLFSKPSIHTNFEVSTQDLDRIHHWVTDVGIRWGLSAEQRKELDLFEFSENSWNDGLTRLLMGYAINSDEPVDGVLPYTDIEGSGALPLGGLCHFIQLIDQARVDFTEAQTLARWEELLLEYSEKMFGELDDPGLVELRTIIGDLASKYGRMHQSHVEFVAIRQWLSTAAAEIKSSSGFLRGGITFCSMLPMRSIPFQCVCLLGINNGVFPAQDRWATFDLMGVQHRWGDRSKRDDDRYQFLEAILAARKQLYVSYVGQSDKSNSPIPPSVVVTELLELLHYGYGIDEVVESHPLQPFNHKYFLPDSPLFSYSEEYCQVATQLLQYQQNPAAWWSEELSDEVEQPIKLASLLTFLTNPQKWFVRNRLGIWPDQERGQIEEREVFSIVGLDAYLVDQQIIDQWMDDKGADDILHRLQSSGHWPLANPGSICFTRKLSELKPFIGKLQQIEMGRKVSDLEVDMRIGENELVGLLSNRFDNGVLQYRYTRCKGKDLIHGYVYFLLLTMLLQDLQEVHLVTRDRHLLFRADREPPVLLERLIELYLEGWKRPIDLFVEPGYHYFKQIQKSRSKVTPLSQARHFFTDQLIKKDGEKSVREPEWAMLYKGVEPEHIIGEQFTQLYDEVLSPIFSFPSEITL